MIASAENNVVFLSFTEGSEEERQTRLQQYFNGDIARWASMRAHQFGELIIPKHVCIRLSGTIRNGNVSPPHRTYYVEHAGTRIADTADTIEEYHCHHMVCDCVLKKNLNDGQGGVDLNACSELRIAARHRARRFGSDIRDSFSDSCEIESDINKILVLSDKAAVAAIETALLVDSTDPEAWPGTVVSGELPIEQASEITGQPLENVVWYADVLQSAGKAIFDGKKISLAA
jgi:hypothetical protein